MMRVVVNGQERDIEAGASVADVIRSLDVDPTQGGVAVALNRQVVARNRWENLEVDDGDHLEVLSAVQGGSQDGRPRPTCRHPGRLSTAGRQESDDG